MGALTMRDDRRSRVRHSVARNGRAGLPAASAPRWGFLGSRLFWGVAAGVIVLHLAVFMAVKDTPVGLHFRQVWLDLEQTFFFSESPAVLDAEGRLVQPGEVRYTVPSKLREAPAPPRPTPGP